MSKTNSVNKRYAGLEANKLNIGAQSEGRLEGKPAHRCLLEEMRHSAASAGKGWLIGEGVQILVEAHEEINAVDTPYLGLLAGY